MRAMKLVTIALLGAGLAAAQLVIPLDPAKNEFPEGVAIDKPGNIWMTVQSLCEVRRYTRNFEQSLRVILVEQNCTGAGGLAVAAVGTAYAAVFTTDPTTRGVYEIQPWGAFRRLPGTGGIISPNALAFDRPNGSLYVTDFIRGAIWKIPQDKPAELWIEDASLRGTLPAPAPFPPTTYLGANGIVFDKDRVTVNITWTPRLVTVPVNPDGSAGTPVVLVTSPQFFAKGIHFLDGLALDVHRDFWIAAPGAGLARVSRDASDIQVVVAPGQQGLTAAALSLAFGAGDGERESLFLTINSSFGGIGNGLLRVPVGVPGLPLP